MIFVLDFWLEDRAGILLCTVRFRSKGSWWGGGTKSGGENVEAREERNAWLVGRFRRRSVVGLRGGQWIFSRFPQPREKDAIERSDGEIVVPAWFSDAIKCSHLVCHGNSRETGDLHSPRPEGRGSSVYMRAECSPSHTDIPFASPPPPLKHFTSYLPADWWYGLIKVPSPSIYVNIPTS